MLEKIEEYDTMDIPCTRVQTLTLNPLRAEFFRENINIYLHLMTFLQTNKTNVVEIPRRVRKGHTCST